MNTQPFRPPFLALPGRPQIPWGHWHCMFEDWLLAIGFPDGDEHNARKSALLHGSLGTEGYRLYSSQTPEAELRESYVNAVAWLKLHFDQPASNIFLPGSGKQEINLVRANNKLRHNTETVPKAFPSSQAPAQPSSSSTRDMISALHY